MKKRLILGAMVALFGGLLLTASVNAQSIRSGTNVYVARDETVDSSLYIAGSAIEVAGTVNGDVFCAGRTVLISGNVNGDVICAAQMIYITGTVAGDARLAAQTVSVSGTVEQNATIASQMTTVEPEASIGGDVSGASNTLQVMSGATVGRDMLAGAGILTIDGTVGRDVTSAIDTLNISQGARIGRNLTYTSDTIASIAQGATIIGTTERRIPEDKSTELSLGGIVAVSFYVYIALMLIIMVLALLLPSALRRVAERTDTSIWKSLLIGLGILTATPFVMVLAAITIVGIPLAILIGLVWTVLLFMSGPFFGYYIGTKVLRSSRNALLIAFVGGTLLLVSYALPVIGGIAMFAAVTIGSGSIVRELASRTPKPVYSPAISKKKTTKA